MNYKHIKKTILILFVTLFTILVINNNTINYNIYATEKISPYTGEIEILSFETLMSFPEKALSENNSYSTLYDETKITTQEFQNILSQLYENNYVIVDIYDIIDRETLTKKQLYLPTNKKPIILTFDNVSYKSNYQNLGQIDKIIIDRNNNLASYTTKKSIQDRIQYNNEFMLILENFINTHKDFSLNNARGIIFFSGENGILGYNTNNKNTSSKYEKKRVIEVIKKLKNLGWKFGANNYSYTDENLKNNMELAKDLSLWNNEIKSIVGDTKLYSFSCPDSNNLSHEKLELLIANGYKIFFENNTSSSTILSKDICFVKTKRVCGNSLRNHAYIFENLFNSNLIYNHNSRLLQYPDRDTKL